MSSAGRGRFNGIDRGRRFRSPTGSDHPELLDGEQMRPGAPQALDSIVTRREGNRENLRRRCLLGGRPPDHRPGLCANAGRGETRFESSRSAAPSSGRCWSMRRTPRRLGLRTNCDGLSRSRTSAPGHDPNEALAKLLQADTARWMLMVSGRTWPPISPPDASVSCSSQTTYRTPYERERRVPQRSNAHHRGCSAVEIKQFRGKSMQALVRRVLGRSGGLVWP